MKQPDPRIGLHGKFAPTVCAATGQSVAGRHNTTHTLRDGFYYRTLNKAKPDHTAIRDELNAVIGKMTKVQSTKVSDSKEASS